MEWEAALIPQLAVRVFSCEKAGFISATARFMQVNSLRPSVHKKVLDKAFSFIKDE